MNKGLFSLVMVLLILASIVFLIIGANEKEPTEFIAILLACLVLSSLFLAIVKGWGIWHFTLLLGVIAVGAIGIGALSMIFFPSAQGYTAINSVEIATLCIYGIRLTSLIWPITVLVIGIKHYQKNTKEE